MIQYALWIGFVLSNLFKIAEEMHRKQLLSEIYAYVRKVKYYSDYFVAFLLFSVVAFPNIRHSIMFGDYSRHILATCLHYSMLALFLFLGL